MFTRTRRIAASCLAVSGEGTRDPCVEVGALPYHVSHVGGALIVHGLGAATPGSLNSTVLPSGDDVTHVIRRCGVAPAFALGLLRRDGGPGACAGCEPSARTAARIDVPCWLLTHCAASDPNPFALKARGRRVEMMNWRKRGCILHGVAYGCTLRLHIILVIPPSLNGAVLSVVAPRCSTPVRCSLMKRRDKWDETRWAAFFETTRGSGP